MRISDWSSDVCSSDLLFGQGNADDLERLASGGRGQRQIAAFAARGGAVEHRFGAGVIDRDVFALCVLFLAIVGVVGIGDALPPELGRASSREGVWQYV